MNELWIWKIKYGQLLVIIFHSKMEEIMYLMYWKLHQISTCQTFWARRHIKSFKNSWRIIQEMYSVMYLTFFFPFRMLCSHCVIHSSLCRLIQFWNRCSQWKISNSLKEVDENLVRANWISLEMFSLTKYMHILYFCVKQHNQMGEKRQALTLPLKVFRFFFQSDHDSGSGSSGIICLLNIIIEMTSL